MFVILALYILTYGALLVVNKAEHVVLLMFALSVGLLLSLKGAGKGMWWYDTILAYPMGMLMSLHKQWISEHLHGRNWLIAISAVGGLFLATYFASSNGNKPGAWPLTLHVISAALFGVVIVLLTMKLKLHNRALAWLGTNAFAIYILQRLAMITCARFGLNANPILFLCVVIPATLLISAVYTAAFNRLRL